VFRVRGLVRETLECSVEEQVVMFLHIVGHNQRFRVVHQAWRRLSHGHPWAHYSGGYQDRLLGGPLGLLDLCYTAPDGVERKDYGGGVLG
jgi:hypothetical protein